MLLILLFITLFHGILLNNYEKVFVQSYWGDYCRPTKQCSKAAGVSVRHLGMPSGHTEVATINAILLMLNGYITAPVALLFIASVGLQRVIFLRHTAPQVFAGLALGLMYSAIYHKLNSVKYSVVFAVCAATLLIAATTIVVDKKVHQPLPRWVDPALYPLIAKKQSIDKAAKFGHAAALPLYHGLALYCSWENLENNLDGLLAKLDAYDFDAVVGIKSGGAIISNYVATRLRLPNYYVKCATNCDKTVTQSLMFFLAKIWRIYGEDVVNPGYRVCEPVSADLEGKRVLLLDELVDTGETMLATRDYLLNEKKASKVTMACLVATGLHAPVEGLVAGSSEIYLAWPWGYDN